MVFSPVAVTDTPGHRGSLAANRHWRVTAVKDVRGPRRRLRAAPTLRRHQGSQFTLVWFGF